MVWFNVCKDFNEIKIIFKWILIRFMGTFRKLKLGSSKFGTKTGWYDINLQKIEKTLFLYDF